MGHVVRVHPKEFKLQNSKIGEKKRCRTTLLKLDMCPLCKYEGTYSSHTITESKSQSSQQQQKIIIK